MKTPTLFLLLFILTTNARAQISWAQYSQTFADGEESRGGPVLIAAIPKENNSFWVTNSGNALQRVFEADTAFMRGRPKQLAVITSFDQNDAQFFVKGISPANMPRYEYRVLKDNRDVIAGWSPLSRYASDSVRSASTLQQLAYLGGYHAAFGHYLVVDLREKNQSTPISSIVVSWQPVRPMLFNIYTANELNGFLQRLSHPNGFNLSAEERQKWQSAYKADELDPVTGLPNKLLVAPADNNLIFVLRADIRSKEQVAYELVKDNKPLRSWTTNEFDNNFIWLKDLPPGEYLLRIRYTAQPENTLDYPFLVKPPPGQPLSYKIGISSLIAAFLGFILFVILYLRQRIKTRRETRQMEKLALEVKSLKSQLNPHFIFNSLSSIQGLINTGQVHEANTYLHTFAGMMRETLTLSEQNQVPLRREIEYLDAYLRLEQLRFNFTYSIFVDPGIDPNDTIFPTLLLQPLVENAVKHGIAGRGKEGNIALRFSRNGQDLAVTLQDNGKGFSPGQDTSGYGLHLTRQRILLLNKAAKEEVVKMEISPDEKNNTTLRLTFKAWLHETDDHTD